VSFEENRLVTPRLALYIADGQHASPGDASIVLVTGDLYPDRLRGEIPLSSRVIVDRSNTFACIRQWERWGAARGLPVEKTGESGPVVITW
jgi:hypothetical protein